MTDGPRILAVIPARGGSKGLPGKNIRPLHGRPLIAWTIAAARGSRRLDRIVVSTDDPAIAAVAAAHGCPVPFLRPAALAADDTPSVDVVLHALDAIGDAHDMVVLLQPTSPLRLTEDIDRAIDLCLERGAPACVSVAPAPKPPEWLMRMDADGRLVPLLPGGLRSARRQDADAALLPNGAVYVARVDWLRRTRSFYAEGTIGFLMPYARSVDIDDDMDFRLAEMRLAAAG